MCGFRGSSLGLRRRRRVRDPGRASAARRDAAGSRPGRPPAEGALIGGEGLVEEEAAGGEVFREPGRARAVQVAEDEDRGEAFAAEGGRRFVFEVEGTDLDPVGEAACRRGGLEDREGVGVSVDREHVASEGGGREGMAPAPAGQVEDASRRGLVTQRRLLAHEERRRRIDRLGRRRHAGRAGVSVGHRRPAPRACVQGSR